MNEETQLRAMSVDFAVKALRDTDGDVIELAQKIYNFLKGEAK